jgi:hypothetical protein
MLGCLVGYIDIAEGSRATLDYVAGYMDASEESRALLGSPVGYTGVIEGSGTMLGCPVGYMDTTKGSRASQGCRLDTWMSYRGLHLPCTSPGTPAWPLTPAMSSRNNRGHARSRHDMVGQKPDNTVLAYLHPLTLSSCLGYLEILSL